MAVESGTSITTTRTRNYTRLLNHRQATHISEPCTAKLTTGHQKQPNQYQKTHTCVEIYGIGCGVMGTMTIGLMLSMYFALVILGILAIGVAAVWINRQPYLFEPDQEMAVQFESLFKAANKISSGFDAFEIPETTDTTMNSLKALVKDTGEMSQAWMRNTATVAGKMATHAETIAGYVTYCMRDDVSISDIIDALKSSLDYAKDIERRVTAMLVLVNDLNKKVKGLSLEYSKCMSIFRKERDDHEKIAGQKTKEARQQKEDSDFAALSAFVLFAVSVASGGVATIIVGTVAGSICLEQSMESDELSARSAQMATEALTITEDARKNMGIASQSSTSLNDIAQHLGVFVAFWAGHSQDLENKIKRLEDMQIQTISQRRFNKLFGNSSVGCWEKFGTKMRGYQNAFNLVSVTGAIEK